MNITTEMLIGKHPVLRWGGGKRLGDEGSIRLVGTRHNKEVEYHNSLVSQVAHKLLPEGKG